jgi:small-conductance mechanosensitive channel
LLFRVNSLRLDINDHWFGAADKSAYEGHKEPLADLLRNTEMNTFLTREIQKWFTTKEVEKKLVPPPEQPRIFECPKCGDCHELPKAPDKHPLPAYVPTLAPQSNQPPWVKTSYTCEETHEEVDLFWLEGRPQTKPFVLPQVNEGQGEFRQSIDYYLRRVSDCNLAETSWWWRLHKLLSKGLEQFERNELNFRTPASDQMKDSASEEHRTVFVDLTKEQIINGKAEFEKLLADTGSIIGTQYGTSLGRRLAILAPFFLIFVVFGSALQQRIWSLFIGLLVAFTLLIVIPAMGFVFRKLTTKKLEWPAENVAVEGTRITLAVILVALLFNSLLQSIPREVVSQSSAWATLTWGSLVDRALVIGSVAVLVFLVLEEATDFVLDGVSKQFGFTFEESFATVVKAFVAIYMVVFASSAYILAFQSQLHFATPDTVIITYIFVGTLITAIIGYVSRESLDSFFAGITLRINPSFELGDRIILEGQPEKRICDVREIGLRNVRLYDIMSNTEIFVPNRKLSGMIITNVSRPDLELRIQIPVMLRGGEGSLSEAEWILIYIAYEEPEVDQALVSDGEKVPQLPDNAPAEEPMGGNPRTEIRNAIESVIKSYNALAMAIDSLAQSRYWLKDDKYVNDIQNELSKEPVVQSRFEVSGGETYIVATLSLFALDLRREYEVENKLNKVILNMLRAEDLLLEPLALKGSNEFATQSTGKQGAKAKEASSTGQQAPQSQAAGPEAHETGLTGQPAPQGKATINQAQIFKGRPSIEFSWTKLKQYHPDVQIIDIPTAPGASWSTEKAEAAIDRAIKEMKEAREKYRKVAKRWRGKNWLGLP